MLWLHHFTDLSTSTCGHLRMQIELRTSTKRTRGATCLFVAALRLYLNAQITTIVVHSASWVRVQLLGLYIARHCTTSRTCSACRSMDVWACTRCHLHSVPQVSILGKAEKVPEAEEEEAAELLFARHPQMKAWALLAHEWQFYELHVEHAYILDWFGPYRAVSKEDYFAAKPSKPL